MDRSPDVRLYLVGLLKDLPGIDASPEIRTVALELVEHLLRLDQDQRLTGSVLRIGVASLDDLPGLDAHMVPLKTLVAGMP